MLAPAALLVMVPRFAGSQGRGQRSLHGWGISKRMKGRSHGVALYLCRGHAASYRARRDRLAPGARENFRSCSLALSSI
jgi:hypothetical protein